MAVSLVTNFSAKSMQSENLQCELVCPCINLRGWSPDRKLLIVWLACTLSFILGLPSLGSTVAFAAATSIATIGLYISYGMSIYSLAEIHYLTLVQAFRLPCECSTGVILSGVLSILEPSRIQLLLLRSCGSYSSPSLSSFRKSM